LALTLIFEEQFSEGQSPYLLTESMKNSGYMKSATNLAAAGLMRKNYVEMRAVQDRDGSQYDAFFVTEKGQDWLLANQQKLNLRIHKPAVSNYDQRPTSPDFEISDDDIPF
jgi:hypothetical protein